MVEIILMNSPNPKKRFPFLNPTLRLDILRKMAAKNFSDENGFTLVELIVVAMMSGILSSIAIPQFTSAVNKAKQKGIPSEKLVVCDATDLLYEENSFDYSYSIGSLEHFTEDQIEKFLTSAKKVTKLYSFHQIPMSRSNKDEGWISPYQSYFNNSEAWWYNHCKKVYQDITILDSTWEDDRSVGKWLILKK